MNNKLVVLSQRMRCEEALLGPQLTVESLQQALQEERVETIVHNGEIIAFGALWPREQSIELGSMWVATEHRGRGFGSTIFSRLVTRAHKNKRLFLISHNILIVHLALKKSMQEANKENWASMVPWSASCGPCDRLKETEKAKCPFMCVEKECRLFFRV